MRGSKRRTALARTSHIEATVGMCHPKTYLGQFDVATTGGAYHLRLLPGGKPYNLRPDQLASA